MESWRSLDAIARAVQALRAPGDAAKVALQGDGKHMLALADQVATAERAVLLALNFDVRLPARSPVRWARDVCGGGGESAAPLEAAALTILRDVGFTPAPLMAPPEALAKAAIWLAARLEAEKKEAGGGKPVVPAPGRLPQRLAAAYTRVPQARVEELARVLERAPAVVRMRAAGGKKEEEA
jgi:hypothetical protein